MRFQVYKIRNKFSFCTCLISNIVIIFQMVNTLWDLSHLWISVCYHQPFPGMRKSKVVRRRGPIWVGWLNGYKPCAKSQITIICIMHWWVLKCYDRMIDPQWWKFSGLFLKSGFCFQNDILKVAGFGQTCSNMHFLLVYGGNLRILRIFYVFRFMDHFHHWIKRCTQDVQCAHSRRSSPMAFVFRSIILWSHRSTQPEHDYNQMLSLHRRKINPSRVQN